MKLTELADDPEDSQHSLAERAAAASRSTWASVGVNLCLSFTQIAVGFLSKSQVLIADGIHSLSDLVAGVMQRHRVLNLMTHVDPWRQSDLDHANPTVPLVR